MYKFLLDTVLYPQKPSNVKCQLANLIRENISPTEGMNKTRHHLTRRFTKGTNSFFFGCAVSHPKNNGSNMFKLHHYYVYKFGRSHVTRIIQNRGKKKES